MRAGSAAAAPLSGSCRSASVTIGRLHAAFHAIDAVPAAVNVAGCQVCVAGSKCSSAYSSPAPFFTSRTKSLSTVAGALGGGGRKPSSSGSRTTYDQAVSASARTTNAS